MSNRELVIELLNRLPEDTPLQEIAREVPTRRMNSMTAADLPS
jgi:hypothetical protein